MAFRITDGARTLECRAYAKINTFLAVTGRLPSGYHTILSHMQSVSLADVLRLTYQAQSGDLSVATTCSDTTLSCGEDNLVCRAAHALSHALAAKGQAVQGHLSVHLDKNIPMAAGLGGGSADAAATLRGFNELLGSPLTMDELCNIAVTLGADVPFCLHACETSAMTARGIGELLTEAPTLPTSAHLVIACDGEGVSTPWAYRALDELGLGDVAESEQEYAAFLKALASGSLDAISTASRNDFFKVVHPVRGAVGKLISAMEAYGAVFARMSGSGPSVVGYFDSERAAAACAENLQKQGIGAHLCRAICAEKAK